MDYKSRLVRRGRWCQGQESYSMARIASIPRRRYGRSEVPSTATTPRRNDYARVITGIDYGQDPRRVDLLCDGSRGLVEVIGRRPSRGLRPGVFHSVPYLIATIATTTKPRLDRHRREILVKVDRGSVALQAGTSTFGRFSRPTPSGSPAVAGQGDRRSRLLRGVRPIRERRVRQRDGSRPQRSRDGSRSAIAPVRRGSSPGPLRRGRRR